MRELACFCGGGGGLLASRLLGWTTVAAIEIEKYPRDVVLQRQRDGMLDKFPIWDDISTFDGKPWRGLVDIVTGGFPCQDISAAGKGKGLAGSRSGLWFEMLRVIGEVKPQYVFAENSPNLRTRGLGTVIQGLAELGYDCRWCVLGAWHVGAPHKRNRMWMLAYPNSIPQGRSAESWGQFHPWKPESKICRVAHGMADRLVQIRTIGNGQVPGVAATAYRILSASL